MRGGGNQWGWGRGGATDGLCALLCWAGLMVNIFKITRETRREVCTLPARVLIVVLTLRGSGLVGGMGITAFDLEGFMNVENMTRKIRAMAEF